LILAKQRTTPQSCDTGERSYEFLKLNLDHDCAPTIPLLPVIVNFCERELVHDSIGVKSRSSICVCRPTTSAVHGDKLRIHDDFVPRSPGQFLIILRNRVRSSHL
jgi:hypothetical protein